MMRNKSKEKGKDRKSYSAIYRAKMRAGKSASIVDAKSKGKSAREQDFFMFSKCLLTDCLLAAR